MSKMYNLMNLTLEEQLKLLWKSGRLSHPLCASPLNMKFIQNLSNEVEYFETYINYFGEEFQQHFSFLFSNYHLSSDPKIKVTSKVGPFFDKINLTYVHHSYVWLSSCRNLFVVILFFILDISTKH